MKTKIPLLLITFFLVSNLQAQLKIDANGNVGIGFPAPLAKLHVNGSIRGDQAFGTVNIQTDYGYLKLGPINTSFSHFYTNSSNYYFDKGLDSRTGQYTSYDGVNLQMCTGSQFTPRIIINYLGGNVGIGTNPMSNAKLNVGGDIWINGTTKVASDIRFKENIKNMDTSYNKIALLQPITYNYTSELHKSPSIISDTVKIDDEWQKAEDIFTKQVRYGFSAQDLQKVYPDLVSEDAEGKLSVDYMGLIPILVEALKEQQVKFEELESKLNILLNKKQ